MNYPSVKTIQEKLSVDSDTASCVRGLIDGMIDPEDFESVQKWIDQCGGSKPRRHEMVMEAINEILDSCGVEAIRGRHVDRFHYDCQAIYVNTGDIYCNTVIRDNETGRFLIDNVGGWIERNERSRELV